MFPHLIWIEISKKALLGNLRLIKKTIPKTTKIMAMVKANAYGHGLDIVAPVLAPHIDFFGVNTIDEALKINHLKNHILITSPISPSNFSIAQKHHFSLCVPSLDYLNKLINYKLPIHLKINTGMNRLGISLVELLSALDTLKHSKLIPEGIYTHFHSSDTNPKSTLSQLDQFNQAVFQAKYNFPKILAHCANSSAIFNYPQTHLDMVRPGLALYTNVLSLYCRTIQTRKISSSDTVGYSATYKSTKDGLMSVLPIGYSDGYDRKLSNNGRVWSGGSYFPIIGRISMNFTTIKAPNITSPIELIGSHITAEEIANLTGTINYEILSRLSPLIPRILV